MVRKRAVQIAFQPPGLAATAQRPPILGVEPDCLVVIFDGSVEVAFVDEDSRAVVARTNRAWS